MTMTANGRKAKISHVSISDAIVRRPPSELLPALENDQVYRPVNTDDPDFRALVGLIRKNGITDPLIHTLDDYLISGHRRRQAAIQLGLPTVPCRSVNILHSDPAYLPLLAACNGQRVKSFDEILREGLVLMNPGEAHSALRHHRREAGKIVVPAITIEGKKHRARITKAKAPFMEAILSVLRDFKDFLPVTDRQIHYALLNDPPLMHASKPDSRYENTLKCYKSLCELLTRARIFELIPYESIHDPTRPLVTWTTHQSVGPYIRQEFKGFLNSYYRDLQQSQPNHIELVGEKNTVQSIIEPVAGEFCIPMTIGRGYSSLPPRWEMAQRFLQSGKENLVVLVLSDFDPEGMDIPHAFARSMRDDFGIENVQAVKVALTADQVSEMNLPPQMKAKKGSRRKKFVERHGDDVFELEAVPPGRLQRIMRGVISSVFDHAAFDREVETEAQEAAQLAALRRDFLDQLKNRPGMDGNI